jgi:hypothetical protein
MAHHRFCCLFKRLLAFGLAVSSLLAYEHHGVVKSGGIPVPGATVTVTQGDKKLVTTTDDQGGYSFPNLGEGVWVLQIEMLGFGTLTREIGIAPDAPVPSWNLQLLSLAALQQALAPAPAAPANTPSAPASPATPPAASATATSANTPAANTAAQNESASGGGRGGTANGRPSLRQAAAQSGFQRMDVNATGDGLNADAGMGADANASGDSSDALMLNGSVSSELGMPQQGGWGGPGGPGGMNGFGPGGMNGMNTPGGDVGNANPTGAGSPGGGPGGRGGGGMAGGGFGGGGGGCGGGGGGVFGGGGGGGADAAIRIRSATDGAMRTCG